MSQTVLIVEDDPDLSQTLKMGLNSEGYEASEAGSLKDALAYMDEQSPLCVLLDLGLPDGSGLAFLKKVRPAYQGPILIVSARGFEAQKIEALDLGADDYLVKPFGMGELLARVRVFQRRLETSERRVLALGDITIDKERRLVLKGESSIHLTPIEFDLLLCLVEARGALVTHRRLLQKIWGAESTDQTQYLRVYMGKLRSKLEDNPTLPSLILTELGLGYRANL